MTDSSSPAPEQPNPADDHGLGAYEPGIDLAGEPPAPAALDLLSEDGAPIENPAVPKDLPVTEEIALPPDTALAGAPTLAILALELEPGPPAAPPLVEAPLQPQPQPAGEDMLALLITEAQLRDLWGRMNTARQRINQQVTNPEYANQLIELLRSARNEILAGRDHYEESEQFLNQVEQRLEMSARRLKWAYSYGWLLFLYELFFGIILVGFLFLWLGEAAFTGGSALYVYLAASLIWGSIGGVTGSMIALVRHISVDQDLDPIHYFWYLASPWMGAAVGLFIFALLQIGVLSIAGETTVRSPFVIYVLAWLGGYQHNIFTGFLKRVLKAFEIDSSSADPQESERK